MPFFLKDPVVLCDFYFEFISPVYCDRMNVPVQSVPWQALEPTPRPVMSPSVVCTSCPHVLTFSSCRGCHHYEHDDQYEENHREESYGKQQSPVQRGDFDKPWLILHASVNCVNPFS